MEKLSGKDLPNILFQKKKKKLGNSPALCGEFCCHSGVLFKKGFFTNLETLSLQTGVNFQNVFYRSPFATCLFPKNTDFIIVPQRVGILSTFFSKQFI